MTYEQQEKVIEFLKSEIEWEMGEMERAEALEWINYHKGFIDALKYVQRCVECNML